MRYIALTMMLLLMPIAASAPPLTKEQLFSLYVQKVHRETIATRLNQLFTNLPAGTFKDQAKATLKQDLEEAIQAELDNYTQKLTSVTTDRDNISTELTNVEETDL